MKRKLLFAIAALLCSVSTWADTDVTDTYIGSATAIINSHVWAPSCTSDHKISAVNDGIGYFNSQDLSHNHSFQNCENALMSGATNPVESWSNEPEGEGYMLGRMMVLPPGKYTLKFSALSRNISNTVVKCGDVEQTFSAAETCEEHTFNLTVTQNTVYQFGVYQKEGGTSDWAAMGSISLTTSTDFTPIAHNSNTDWTDGIAVNTWSTEGKSDNTYFLEPFLQKWTSSATLDNGTYQKSYTPSKSGFYRVNAWVRLIKESAGQDTYSGATMFAGTNSVSVCSGGTLYNSKKVHLGTYSAKIDATKDVAFNYGFTLSSANFNWLSFKNITIEKITLDEFAETFSSGSTVTDGTWYKLTTGSGKDAYILSSNGDATITYTTDGTLSDDADVSDTWTLHAKRNAVLAPNTTYYIKSSAAVTLTTGEASVEPSYVSGWEKVTEVSQLQTNPENYFFAIFSANNTGLMLKNRTTANDEKQVYVTAVNPLSGAEYLFEMENYDGQFVLKSVLSGKYFENRPKGSNLRFEGDGPWNYHADLTTKDANCKTTLSWVNNAFIIQTKNKDEGNDYLGLWYDGSSNEGYKNNEILAGNKPEKSKASFIIYRIAKDALNTSSLITNPGFDACTAETSDVAAKTIKNYSSNGWTNANTGSFTTIAVTAYGGGKKVGGSTTPSTKKDGSTVSGNALGIIAGWGDEVKIQSGDIILPAGGYTLTVDHYLTSATSNYDSSTTSYVGFVTASNSYLVSSTTFTASTWTTETVTFTLSEPTTGKIQIGLKGNNKSGSDSPAVFYDDVTLTYYPFADASDYTALAAAITTAEAKALGFETGEYAPYNNVAALTALATAKAINPIVANGKNIVQPATTALTGASWTANATDVNAIYDGNFKLQEEHTSSPTSLIGWTEVEGIRQLIKNTTTDVGLASLEEGSGAVFAWGNTTLTYGEKAGYTLPLAAHTIYELSLKVTGWRDSNLPTAYYASVLYNGNGLANGNILQQNVTKRVNEEDPFVDVSILFATGEAGNYILTLNSPANQAAVISDIKLQKAASQTLSLPSTTQYAPGTYPAVALDRTFASTSNWYTLCAPFDFPKSAFAEVKVLDHVTDKAGDVNMTFTDAGSTITAGTPCLVKPASADATLCVENVAINPATSAGSTVESDGTTTVTYVGKFENTVINGSTVTNAWVVSNNALYHVAEGHNATVGAYRAYFTVATGGTVKALSYDFGDAVGINAIDNGQLTIDNDKVIYNLAGQKMNKLQRGVNIVNGKKVLVK